MSQIIPCHSALSLKCALPRGLQSFLKESLHQPVTCTFPTAWAAPKLGLSGFQPPFFCSICLDWRRVSSWKTRAQLILWISPITALGSGIKSHMSLHIIISIINSMCLHTMKWYFSLVFVKLSRYIFPSILAFNFDLSWISLWFLFACYPAMCFEDRDTANRQSDLALISPETEVEWNHFFPWLSSLFFKIQGLH